MLLRLLTGKIARAKENLFYPICPEKLAMKKDEALAAKKKLEEEKQALAEKQAIEEMISTVQFPDQQAEAA
jgi:hypothetical protein